MGSDEGRGADQQVMRIAGALADVVVGDLIAAARPVDDRHRSIHQLAADERALDRACELVVGAAGRYRHDQLDVLLRRPALRLLALYAQQT